MGAVSVLLDIAGTDGVLTRIADIEQITERVDKLLPDLTNAILWEQGHNLDMVEMIEYALDVASGRI